VRIAATFLVLAIAGVLRATIGHRAAYAFIGLCIAVPRAAKFSFERENGR
jgi:hypothetical protein